MQGFGLRPQNPEASTFRLPVMRGSFFNTWWLLLWEHYLEGLYRATKVLGIRA